MEQRREIKSFRDLLVWQKGMNLVRSVYQFTRKFPDDERFGLASQIRRAAVSIPSNIAEGYGRNSTSDYARFIRMAIGSLFELHTQLEIAHSEKMLNSDTFSSCNATCNELEKMLVSLAMKLENHNK